MVRGWSRCASISPRYRMRPCISARRKPASRLRNHLAPPRSDRPGRQRHAGDRTDRGTLSTSAPRRLETSKRSDIQSTSSSLAGWVSSTCCTIVGEDLFVGLDAAGQLCDRLRPLSPRERAPATSPPSHLGRLGKHRVRSTRSASHSASSSGKTVPIGATTIWCDAISGSDATSAFGMNGLGTKRIVARVVSSSPSPRSNRSSSVAAASCGGSRTRPTRYDARLLPRPPQDHRVVREHLARVLRDPPADRLQLSQSAASRS
jgi:hypothetical protein